LGGSGSSPGSTWPGGNIHPMTDEVTPEATMLENRVKAMGLLQKEAELEEIVRLVGKDALYDINSDPGEKINVIEEYPEVARKMLEAYDVWWDEVRPLMINEDAPLDTGKPFIIQFEKQKKEKGIPDWIPPQI